MTSYNEFSSYIEQHARSLATDVVETVMHRLNLSLPSGAVEQTIEMYVNLLGFLGLSLIEEDEEAAPDLLIAWSKQNAAWQVKSGGKLSEIGRRYPVTREYFIDLLTEISDNLGMSVQQNAFIIKRINRLLDVSLNETIFAFEQLSEQVQKETQEELINLSAPLVPVRDNIVIMPLIGYIDEDRSAYITDRVIPRMADMGVSHVIIDYSGVHTINERIAEALHQIGSMIRLMGIQIVVAGLRPDLVRTVVTSGLEVKRVRSYSTVKQALESL